MIYDCFTFFNELDLLEIRLQELKDVVDRFVLVEATKTFSNRPKRLFYEENKERFKDFHDRIIHIIVDDLPEEPKDSWENQYFQRNAISRGLVDCSPDDIIIVSDLDEIPRASAIAAFDGEIAFLEQNLYYYRLNCICTTAKWAIPIMLRYRQLTTPQEVRMYWYDRNRRQQIPTIPDGGWHFSYLGDVESIQLKLNSFSQQDFNTPEVNNKESIEKKIDGGEDLFGRPQYQWAYVKIDHTYPRTIYDNIYRYARYIKGRDLEGTVFFDQYSRYKTCADLLKVVSHNQATILDVGSGADCLMGEFLPDREITFIDPLIANLQYRPSYKLAGDAFSEDLDGKSFDYVVSVDTLEHVPAEYRVRFVERLSTLAKQGLVLAFPACDAGDAVETDAWLNSVYRMAYGKDYCWLEEHLRNGLPSLQDTLEQLTSLGWQTKVIQNGHTPWMRELLSLTLCGLEIDSFKQIVLELSTYFNHHLQPFDSAAPGYRQIVIAVRPEAGYLSAIDVMTDIDVLSAIEHWNYIRRKIAASPYHKLVDSTKAIKEKEQQLADKESQLLERSQQLAETSKHMTVMGQQLTERELQLEEKGRVLAEKDQTLADRNNHISKLEHEISERNQHIRMLDQHVADQGLHIAKLDQCVSDSTQHASNLEKYLFETNQLISRLDERLSSHTELVAALNQDLAERKQHITRLEQELAAKQFEIAKLDQDVAAKEKEISKLDQDVTAKEKEINKLDQDVAAKEKEINKLDQDVTTKEKEIAKLNQEVAVQKEQITGFTHDLTERTEQLAKLNQELSSLQLRVSMLEGELSDKIAGLATTQKELSVCKLHVEELMSSKSWRLTAPLRKMHDLMIKK